MASISIRKLDDSLKAQLSVHAARRGHSMEEEVRVILRDALEEKKAGPTNLAAFTREWFAPFGGIELDPPPRSPMREPPRFS